VRPVFTFILFCSALISTAVVLFLFSLREQRPRIYFATANGDTNAIAEYLHSGGNVNTPIVCHPFGGEIAPLLDIAIEHGQIKTVRFLLSNGADPSELDDNGNSPAFWSVGVSENGISVQARVEILKTLLEAGANTEIKSTAAAWTPLMQAAELGELDMVRALLAADAKVNTTNNLGQTALSLASDPETTNLLINAGGRRPKS
jgi:ankyrin repeat protein